MMMKKFARMVGRLIDEMRNGDFAIKPGVFLIRRGGKSVTR
jgi:hypothetical protein